MSSRIIIRLAFLGALIVWAVTAFLDVMALSSDLRGFEPGFPMWLPRAGVALYVLMVYVYYARRDSRYEHRDFTGSLRRVFITGAPIIVLSFVVRLVLYLLGDTKFSSNVLFVDIIYQINLALFLSFLLSALVSWRRLILHQRSKFLTRLWRIFQWGLVGVLLLDITGMRAVGYLESVVLVGLGLLAVALSVNVKWIAYLTTKQKWTSLFLLVFIFSYLYYFRYTVINLSDEIREYSTVFVDFRNHTLSLSLFGFVMLYGLFSFFVLLFNLPTSSVFERKLDEAALFRKISRSIQTEQNEESIYRMLLTSAVQAAFADAAWIDVEGNEEKGTRFFTHDISVATVQQLNHKLAERNIEKQLRQDIKDRKKAPYYAADFSCRSFHSVLVMPIVVNDKMIGTLRLLKRLSSGFNKEIVNVVEAFNNQARISIENFRLLKETLQNERYKEEVKIAKRVHKKLLPDQLAKNSDFDIDVFSKSADGVGGDYYDTLRLSDTRIALVIADVSGKGTTAAFHMAQMKGIFHSLARQGLDPEEFMLKANEALISCLERGAFISAIYFVIDAEEKTIQYARAGHCPVLYYRAQKNQTIYLKDKGTALGIIPNRYYAPLIDTRKIAYHDGDVMALYTDGITEAKNKKGEEYGYKRLEQNLYKAEKKNVKKIQERLIADLYTHLGTAYIMDDYTSIIVRFKERVATQEDIHHHDIDASWKSIEDKTTI